MIVLQTVSVLAFLSEEQKEAICSQATLPQEVASLQQELLEPSAQEEEEEVIQEEDFGTSETPALLLPEGDFPSSKIYSPTSAPYSASAPFSHQQRSHDLQLSLEQNQKATATNVGYLIWVIYVSSVVVLVAFASVGCLV